MIQLTFKTKQKEETQNFGKPYALFYIIISTILKPLNKTNTVGEKKKRFLLKSNLNMVCKALSYFQEQYFSHTKNNWNVID